MSMVKAFAQPGLEALDRAQRVLVCGCGGGYDVFSGLPIFLALKRSLENKKFVLLGNLTFTGGWDTMDNTIASGVADATTGGTVHITPVCKKVTSTSKRTGTGWTPQQEHYWPEMHLARFLETELGASNDTAEQGELCVYMFERTGVLPLREAYQKIVDDHQIDTVLVVDGGTDSLMFGDEEGLGSPSEDMMSIGAVNGLVNVKQKLLFCIGMGVDCFHGVSHARFLENVSTVTKAGGFMGSWSLHSSFPEADITRRAYEACKPENSIVTSSIISAVQGEFGNVHHPATAGRTAGSKLFISALMSQYWAFDLPTVASEVKYMAELEKTVTGSDVRRTIQQYQMKFFKNGQYVGTRPSCPIEY